jgi:hypothetical protein
MFMTGISGIIPGTNSVAVGAPEGTDPYWSNTVLLMGFDGVSGSTSMPDESFANHGLATVTGGANDAQIATNSKKFGSGSARLDGSSDTIRYADSADWLLAGDFTIEGWFLFDPDFIGASAQTLVCQWETGSQRSWIFSVSTTALQFTISTNGTAAAGAPFPLSSNWTPTASTWYHLAVDRSGNTWRLYRDGTMLQSVTSASTPFDSTTNLRIGASASLDGGLADNFFKGNVDELRITKGVARYAADGGYSVPTAAFPRS